MIYEKQRIMGWVNVKDVPKLNEYVCSSNKIFIHDNDGQKFKKFDTSITDRIPCYYNPPEHPSVVMSNVFECVVSINSLFDERSK
jgi:hypothetical protein